MTTPKYTSNSGIYIIINTTNNHFYIGMSNNIKKRWQKHIRELNSNSHANQKMQRAWIRDGGENFIFSILEHCESDFLIQKEQVYLTLFVGQDYCYNISSISGGGSLKGKLNHNFGKHLPDVVKERISLSKRGKKLPPFSEEHRRKIGQYHIGKQIWLGRKHSEQSKEKSRLSNLGKKRSKETCENISKSLSGRVLSNDHKNHLSLMFKGDKNPNKKLTFEIVREIRFRFNSGETDKRLLAKEYGVTPKQIHNIVTNKQWKEK